MNNISDTNISDLTNTFNNSYTNNNIKKSLQKKQL